MFPFLRHRLIFAVAAIAGLSGCATIAPKPLRILLITGGCCHDYAAQKDLLKKGLEARANVVVEQMHTADKTTKPVLACLTNPGYAAGYDLVIHDECAAGITDIDMVKNVLKPHLDGIPAVNLHCAMHCYRVAPDFGRPMKPGSEGAPWFDYIGLQSSGHGPQEPIAITYVDQGNPITKSFADWTTIKEELYNNVQNPTVFPGHRSLATGKQIVKNKDGTTKTMESVVVWTNEYGPRKTRVFSTTIGHNNATVEDPRYMDLVTRGVLWAAGKLGADGQPIAGYESRR